MKAIGVTGTRHGGTDIQLANASSLLLIAWHSGMTEFHYGFCQGVDEQLARTAHRIGFTLVAHPAKDPRWQPVNPITPDVTMAPRPYKVRDAALVRASIELIGVPRQSQSHEPRVGARGEGTWWTIRCAINTDVPVHIIWPDGEVERR